MFDGLFIFFSMVWFLENRGKGKKKKPEREKEKGGGKDKKKKKIGEIRGVVVEEREAGKNSLGMDSSQSSSLWRFDDSSPCLPQKGQEARTSLDSHG